MRHGVPLIASGMRGEIRIEVEGVVPFDDREQSDKRDVLAWVDSGAELCRVKTPDVPPMHLISYFVVIDGDQVLLVDHICAGLWLPTGGHVEPGEHPRQTVVREALEELGLRASFARDGPGFVTVTQTVGRTAGHTDVSLWYVLAGDDREPIAFDESEFRGAQWFHRSRVPLGRSDPQMGRFLKKYFASSLTIDPAGA